MMRLSTPKSTTAWIATILALLGLLGHSFEIPFVSQYAFWFVVVAYVVLFLGVSLKDF